MKLPSRHLALLGSPWWARLFRGPARRWWPVSDRRTPHISTPRGLLACRSAEIQNSCRQACLLGRSLWFFSRAVASPKEKAWAESPGLFRRCFFRITSGIASAARAILLVVLSKQLGPRRTHGFPAVARNLANLGSVRDLEVAVWTAFFELEEAVLVAGPRSHTASPGPAGLSAYSFAQSLVSTWWLRRT